ncbi:GNAT family N-acetyltransferase [Pseudohoeflea coraliihabitans]|uniref:GNAT family N-acetyltransferase n=1 Tax=Pseudohoeflea coraliihabitans TaxID=2860393 RepID=A0ABS6WKI3_9HYPH|nr:GNAT family protein [Pseudohoeflea sp. DP4N28-3]MBW3096385.1 GNAT family N-acetyltransferase [Pseudohoeflea sp. DP4N28-3]
MTDLEKWTGRPAPQPVALSGRHVMIEPFRRDVHTDALWDAFGGAEVNALLRYFFSGPFEAADQLAAWLEETAAAGTIVNVFRSRRSGDVVGMASYMRPDPTHGVIEIGSVAHGKAMARTPMATEAHYLLAKHVFCELGYRRYEWKCDALNLASRRSALRLGFSFEGIFRQHMVVKGANRDTAWYAMLDHEWPAIQAGFEEWLASENFDDNGQQQQTLESCRRAGNANRKGIPSGAEQV